MGVLRSLTRWLKRLFRKTEDTLISVDENDAYEETLISYLETLPKGRKEMKLKKNGSRFSWKGEISSMIDAYLFLTKLPSVCIDNITHHFASDCLIYHIKVNENHQIVMREKYIRSRRIVDLILNNCRRPVNIRLSFKNETYEEKSHLCADTSAYHSRSFHSDTKNTRILQE